jgi:hypothetical protein
MAQAAPGPRPLAPLRRPPGHPRHLTSDGRKEVTTCNHCARTTSNAKLPRGHRPENSDCNTWWAGISAIAAVLAIGGAVAAVLAILPSDQHATQGAPHSSTSSPILSEEHMVSLLIAGDDYEKMVALIGAPPDFQKNLPSGRQLYVFDRPWDYIQLLVSDGTVLSVGVYAKTTKFKTMLVTGTIVNGPPVEGDLIGAYGACGAPWYLYFQGYSGADVNRFRSVIVGELPVTDTNEPMATGAPCKFLFSSASCITDYMRSFLTNSTPFLSMKLITCINSLKGGRTTLANLVPSIVIVTAPDQPILPDMLNEQYFYTLAKV